MSDTPTYPKPFFVRLCAPSPRAGIVRAFLTFSALFLVGLVIDVLLSIHNEFPLAFLLLAIYCAIVSFGLWGLCHVYWQTKHTLEETGLVEQTRSCLREIYASKPILICGAAFAVFVGLVQIALQFKVSLWISIYFCLWNGLAGFVIGLGLWTACGGSLRLAGVIGKSNLHVFLLSPFQTPSVRRLSRLMLTYSVLFTFEVLLFSVAVTVAAVTLNARALPIPGSKFTAFDVAGASSFFFLALFSPLYTLVLQQRILSAVRRAKEIALAELDKQLRTALEDPKSPDREKLSDLLSTNQTVRDTRELPFAVDNVTKLLSILLPGLAYLYSKNSELINELGQVIVKAFLPSVGK